MVAFVVIVAIVDSVVFGVVLEKVIVDDVVV